MDQRYEQAEKELFSRMESIGREIKDRVAGHDSSRLQSEGLNTESAAAERSDSTHPREAVTRGKAQSTPGRGVSAPRKAKDPKAALPAEQEHLCDSADILIGLRTTDHLRRVVGRRCPNSQKRCLAEAGGLGATAQEN